MKPPAFQFYADDFLALKIGQPPRGRTASAMMDPVLFVKETWYLTASETGELLTRVLRLLRQRDFEAISQFAFVVRVFRGTHKRNHIPSDVRRRVLAAGVCAQCKSTDRLEIDHIISVFAGGTDDESNLRCLCKACNLKKGAK